MSGDDLWCDEYERTADAYVAGAITLEEFRSRMRRLGFEPPEIDGYPEMEEHHVAHR